MRQSRTAAWGWAGIPESRNLSREVSIAERAIGMPIYRPRVHNRPRRPRCAACELLQPGHHGECIFNAGGWLPARQELGQGGEWLFA
jgi:hypothetical protein